MLQNLNADWEILQYFKVIVSPRLKKLLSAFVGLFLSMPCGNCIVNVDPSNTWSSKTEFSPGKNGPLFFLVKYLPKLPRPGGSVDLNNKTLFAVSAFKGAIRV